MNSEGHSSTGRVLRGLLAGVVAGAVASFAMDRFQAAVAALSSDEDGDSAPATEQAADAIAATVTGHAVPTPDKPLAGQAAHYALGVALGAAYGVAAEFRPAVTAGRGAAFGIGAATLLDEATVPAAGLSEPPWRVGLGSTLYGYVSHIVFGAALELVRGQTASTLRPKAR